MLYSQGVLPFTKGGGASCGDDGSCSRPGRPTCGMCDNGAAHSYPNPLYPGGWVMEVDFSFTPPVPCPVEPIPTGPD